MAGACFPAITLSNIVNIKTEGGEIDVLTKAGDSNLKPTASKIYAKWRSKVFIMLGLAAALVFVILFATTIGSAEIPFATSFKIFLSKMPFLGVEQTWPDSSEIIVWDIRFPRALLAGIVGAALSLAGASYQGLFRNPLADPYLIGVTQGAALGAVIAFLLPISIGSVAFGTVPIFAFIGALVSVLIVYSIARSGGTLPTTTLILAGVALGAFLSAIVSYLITVSGDKIHSVVFWLMGSFSLTSWDEVQIALPIVLIGIIVILLNSRALNLIQLGEEQAQQLGVDVEKLKIILLIAATLVTAVAVSFVGIIGFVGIIIPHAVRLMFGADHRFLLPISVLVGAIFLIIADIVARTIMAPTEIPIGVITAFCGAPFFLYLLRKRMRMLF